MENKIIFDKTLSNVDFRAQLISKFDSQIFSFLCKRFGCTHKEIANLPRFNKSAGTVYNYLHGFYKIPVTYSAIVVDDLFIEKVGVEVLRCVCQEYSELLEKGLL